MLETNAMGRGTTPLIISLYMALGRRCVSFTKLGQEYRARRVLCFGVDDLPTFLRSFHPSPSFWRRSYWLAERPFWVRRHYEARLGGMAVGTKGIRLRGGRGGHLTCMQRQEVGLCRPAGEARA